METLKYTIIKNKLQYNEYCKILEELLCEGNKIDEIDLITLLIEDWDTKLDLSEKHNPVEFAKILMKENNLKSKDLAKILELSKGTVSKILNYKKGFSKNTIRKLSEYFKVSQNLFNQPYKLKDEKDKQINYSNSVENDTSFGNFAKI